MSEQTAAALVSNPLANTTNPPFLSLFTIPPLHHPSFNHVLTPCNPDWQTD